jgi:succinate dehydrogenase/fumarate reductase flavoprotein subunit
VPAAPETLSILEVVVWHSMIFGRYYVADISHRPNNPIHRVIVYNVQTGGFHAYVCGGGYELKDRVIDYRTLAHFKLICEIEEMRPERNSYKLPGSL